MDPKLKLRQFFIRVHARYTDSPYVADLAALAHWLTEKRYSFRYAQRVVFRVRQSLMRARFLSDHRWTETELSSAFLRCGRKRKEYQDARHVYREFLGSIGRLSRVATVDTPTTAIISAYAQHLHELRGLAPATIQHHLWHIGDFLRAALQPGEGVEALTAETVTRYIEQRSRRVTSRALRATVLVLRAFLKFGLQQRALSAPLDDIDLPMGFRDDHPPRALPWPTVQKLVGSIDRQSRTGQRDFLILHLMAHYGLRPGEIAKLTPASINWTERTLLVEQSKTRSWLTLPLHPKTINLLERYVRLHRGDHPIPLLFHCGVAPYGPMTKFSISAMFRIRARKSGLPIGNATAYSLRHSFAMRLFGRGVGIKAIGDVMGHQSIVSTAVYLRLQIEALREVALPVPTCRTCAGGAS